MVSRYGDFIEWILDLKVSGGLTGPERERLRKGVIEKWKKTDSAAKERFLRELKKWCAIAQLDEVRRAGCQCSSRGKFLGQLRRSDVQDPDRWLLARYDKEQELLKRQAGN
jgi:hypothetical protein